MNQNLETRTFLREICTKISADTGQVKPLCVTY